MLDWRGWRLPSVYDSLGVRGLFQIKDEGVMLAADTGFLADTFDPAVRLLRAGLKGSVQFEKVSLDFNPAVHIGVTEREVGNEEILYAPVGVRFLAALRLLLEVQSGAWGPLDELDNACVLPLGFGGMFEVNERLGVKGPFHLADVCGRRGLGLVRWQRLPNRRDLYVRLGH